MIKELMEGACNADQWEGLISIPLGVPSHILSMYTCYPVQGVTSWFVFYLIKAKGVEDAAQVSSEQPGQRDVLLAMQSLLGSRPGSGI
jgi:hypothetical protein